MTTGSDGDRHRAHEALAVASRVRLLDTLRAAERPLTAGELASASGLHVSTVRFHLRILGTAGLVRCRPEAAGTRGRPRLLYSPVTAGGPGPYTGPGAGYRLLASLLAAHWGDTPDERSERAERAGHAAATVRHLVPGGTRSPASGPRAPTTMHAAVAEVSATFAELGFEPDVVPDGAGLLIRLHACPFREVATQHPEVVCSLHLGLIRGALAEAGGAAAAVGLQPSAEPHPCVARVVATGPAPGEPREDSA